MSYPNSVHKDIEQDRRIANRVSTWTEEFTNVATADTDAILLAKATIAAQTTYNATDLDGVIGDGAISPPRNITVTTAGGTAADAPATVVVTGTDVNGDVQTETLNVGQTATTVAGAKAFASVTSLVFAAADGTDATVAVGFGAIIGLARKPKTRGGTVYVLNETAAGSRVTNGTFVIPATSGPNGTYAPNSAPNGTNDYVITYELDDEYAAA